MNFERVIRHLVNALEERGVSYALIGGFAMALRGVQRATVDLDLILMLEHLETADQILTDCSYVRVFRSENVSHYESTDGDWGRIDILHAFRGPSLGMLERAEPIKVFEDVRVKVVQIEDLIGLKIQALVNNPSRADRDWMDVRLVLEAAAEQGREMDWELIASYLEIFGMTAKLGQLKDWYGEAH
jgi:predicted nucleotidyltransferase